MIQPSPAPLLQQSHLPLNVYQPKNLEFVPFSPHLSPHSPLSSNTTSGTPAFAREVDRTWWRGRRRSIVVLVQHIWGLCFRVQGIRQTHRNVFTERWVSEKRRRTAARDWQRNSCWNLRRHDWWVRLEGSDGEVVESVRETREGFCRFSINDGVRSDYTGDAKLLLGSVG